MTPPYRRRCTTRWKGRWWHCDRAFVIHFGSGAARRCGGRGRGARRRGGTGQEGQGHLYGAGRGGILGAAGVQLRSGRQLSVPALPGGQGGFRPGAGPDQRGHVRGDGYRVCPVAGEKAGGGGAGDLRRGGGGAGPEGQAGKGTEGRAITAREEPAAGQAPRSRRQAAGTAPRVSGASGTGAQAPRVGTPASAAAGVSGGTPRPGL